MTKNLLVEKIEALQIQLKNAKEELDRLRELLKEIDDVLDGCGVRGVGRLDSIRRLTATHDPLQGRGRWR